MFVLISNIPISFHTPDLRNYFSFAIEKEFFDCFNYRQRPHASKKFNVCVINLKEFKYDEFLKLYDNKNWINTKGELERSKCSIAKIKTSKEIGNEGDLTQEDINGLLEFTKIPDWMPQGNVGTPTKTFIKYINQCIMPNSLISKLGLDLKSYNKHKKKVYSSVEYKYEDDYYEPEAKSDTTSIAELDHEVVQTAKGHRIDKSIDDDKEIREINYEKKENEKEVNDSENEVEGNDDDGDDLEEWERHEALHDDVTKQDRTSPYFFEQEIELKWEKGGSGLVFYTVGLHLE